MILLCTSFSMAWVMVHMDHYTVGEYGGVLEEYTNPCIPETQSCPSSPIERLYKVSSHTWLLHWLHFWGMHPLTSCMPLLLDSLRKLGDNGSMGIIWTRTNWQRTIWINDIQNWYTTNEKQTISSKRWNDRASTQVIQTTCI